MGIVAVDAGEWLPEKLSAFCFFVSLMTIELVGSGDWFGIWSITVSAVFALKVV